MDSLIYKNISKSIVEIPTTAIEAYVPESTAVPIETQPPTTVPIETQPPTTEITSIAIDNNEDNDIEEKLLEKALDYYEKVNGHKAPYAMIDSINGDMAVIHIYYDGVDAISTADWYEVNIHTGRGTDFWGNNIAIFD